MDKICKIIMNLQPNNRQDNNSEKNSLKRPAELKNTVLNCKQIKHSFDSLLQSFATENQSSGIHMVSKVIP